jgi:hypothetical protein
VTDLAFADRELDRTETVRTDVHAGPRGDGFEETVTAAIRVAGGGCHTSV